MTSASVWIHYVIQPVQQTFWLVRITGRNLFRFGSLTTEEIITGYTLLLGQKLDVTPHPPVRPTSGSKQCNGAKQQTSNEPRHGSAPFRLSDFRCEKAIGIQDSVSHRANITSQPLASR